MGERGRDAFWTSMRVVVKGAIVVECTGRRYMVDEELKHC